MRSANAIRSILALVFALYGIYVAVPLIQALSR